MKQYILIHGAPYEAEFYDLQKPSPSNTNWFPWLQKQLGVCNELCQALEFPRPFDPVYADWLAVFEQMKLTNETVLVGHSCGGGFLLRFLSEHPDVKVAKVFLVAPWLDPDTELTTSFFEFDIDPHLTERNELHIFTSSDDESSLLKSFEIIREKLPNANYHAYTDKGHFCETEFPELLKLLS